MPRSLSITVARSCLHAIDVRLDTWIIETRVRGLAIIAGTLALLSRCLQAYFEKRVHRTAKSR